MVRYHPRFHERDDPDLLPYNDANRGSPSKNRPRRRVLCRRPSLALVLAWVCFAFLLSIKFLTLSKEGQPVKSKLLGWQAFENIGKSLGYTAGQSSSELASQGAGHGHVSGASFPLDVYAPLVPNPEPLTDITVHSCLPIRLSSCRPPTTPKQDAELGPWVLVPRPLDSEAMSTQSIGATGLGGALSHIFGALGTNYVFYRRSRRHDVPKIIDLRLVETGQDPPTTTETGWHRVHDDLRNHYMRVWAGQKGLHLYYRTIGGAVGAGATGTAGDGTWDKRDESPEPITEIEMVYGDGNHPWPGFFIVGQVGLANAAMGHSSVWLTARRGPHANPAIDAHPRFRSDGTFKILQLADLHFSIEEEPCRDVRWDTPSTPCRSVNDTLRVVEQWLDSEKPDLVVFTGDQLNGQSSSWDAKSVVTKWTKPIIDRKIQFAAILGNHDSEQTSVTRAEIVLLLSRLPYSLTRVGPPQLHDGEGAGNYYIRLDSPTPDRTNIFNLFFLDSGMHAPNSPWTPPWSAPKEYDYVRQDQIDWVKSQLNESKSYLRPYKPDGGVDLPAQNWVRSGEERWDAHAAQGTRLAKPNAMLFVHIPVPEAFDNSSTTPRYGPWRSETATKAGAQKQAGLFEALLHPAGEGGVRVIDSGHMHNNGDCEEIAKGVAGSSTPQKIWTCFGGGSSFAGYGHVEVPRMARVFQLSKFGEQAFTWTRLDNGTKAFEGQLWDDTAL